ncbi:uncharacterized protein LOC126109529 [Schistocerca cancellata]|uniref:uncharacterized protein LOC126109529 n=1 Tax=Schistocerca cancellata TaxID=274614 RepID=UPI0021187928|nr:uncharacterized protein LOC126109529 [Schistocerca cancellata]
MEDNRDTAGPSEPKKRKTQDTRNVQKLTDAELLRILEESDSETELASEEDGVESSEESDGAEFVLDETVEMAVNPSDREMAEGVVTRDNAADTTVAWEREPVGMINCPFIKNEGLLIQPTENTPLDYFRLLLTDEFLLTVVEETNRNAIELFLSAGTKGQSRINCWKDVTVGELLVFLGVFLHMGNVKMRNLQDYWKKDALFNVKGIADSISRNRFLLILRALHFSENPKQGKPTPSDRLYKIRPVINFFNERMCQVYYPGWELSLDESMILWRGRLLFRRLTKRHFLQHIPATTKKYAARVCHLKMDKFIIRKKFDNVESVGDGEARPSVSGAVTQIVTVQMFEEKRFQFSCKMEKPVMETGFSNWKKGVEKLKAHEASGCHREAVLKSKSLKSNVNVFSQIYNNKLTQMKENRVCLLKIISSLRYLTVQGLAMRGHIDEASNFDNLLRFRCEDNQLLLIWLQRRTYKWTSHDVQNEILAILSHTHLRQLLEDIKIAEYFAIIADETTDIATKEQFSICIRFVDASLEME